MDDIISVIEKRILSEENTSQQYLGMFLIGVSILNILEAIAKILFRFVFRTNPELTENAQAVISAVKLVAVAAVYVYCLYRMKKLYFHSPDVRKLLFIWGIILIPIQIIYDFSTVLYKRMLDMVLIILNTNGPSVENDTIYAIFYNSTHGFKYMGMFLAILLGIVVTGEILEKNRLILICGILATVFMFAFSFVKMQTVSLDILPINIGINLTSMLFHSLTTLGLLILGIYILRKYTKKEIAL